MAINSDTKKLIPLRAALATRLIYGVSLLALILLALVAGSGWIGLAMGGGLISQVGFLIFSIIVVLLLFRLYQVLRYPAALDARPPNLLGWLFRYTGLFAMLVETAAVIGFIFLKPLTLALYDTAGPNGIAYFATGLYLMFVAKYSWFGFLIFEVSRICGRKTPRELASLSWSKRWQDFSVLGLLFVAVVITPYLFRQFAEGPCGVTNLARCVSTTEGGVVRMIGLPHGEPVYLETELEEISMYSGAGEHRRKILVESPAVSLDASGHPVTTSADARAHVRLDVEAAREGVVLTLMVIERGKETARFITRFAEDATIEKMDSGKVRVAVNLPDNANPGMRRMHKGGKGREYYALDQIFIQLRSAIGSELEAREWDSRIIRTAKPIDGALEVRTRYSHDRFRNGPIDRDCDGIVEGRPDQAVSYDGNFLGSPLWGAMFREAESPGPHALLDRFDRLVCYEDEIWIVSYDERQHSAQIRRYTRNGRLMRFISVAVPPTKLGKLDFDSIDPFSILEDNGKIYFERVVRTPTEGELQEKRRELLELIL